MDAATDVAMTREERIVALMPLVSRLARKVANKVPSVDYEDLVSEGLIGAIQAVDRWDPEQGVVLGAFARRRISGQMYDFLRATGPLSRKHWANVLEGIEEFALVSLDEPVRSSGISDDPMTLVDLLPDDEDSITRMINALAIREVIASLPEKHARILNEYYFEGLTLRQIGERHGYTESRASQRLSAAHEIAYRILEQPDA